MPTARGSQKFVHVRMGGPLHDRLIVISSRLGLPLNEIILRLILVGLDTSQDLALERPVYDGIARFPNVSV